MKVIDKLFLTHPRTVDETYFEHMKFALSFFVQLQVCALAALAHAFVPCLFEKTASKKITNLYGRIHNR